MDERHLDVDAAPRRQPRHVFGREHRPLSIVFFHQPNYDAVIECLPSCLAPGESPKYAPISSGDHLKSKFVKQTTFGKGEKAA